MDKCNENYILIQQLTVFQFTSRCTDYCHELVIARFLVGTNSNSLCTYLSVSKLTLPPHETLQHTVYNKLRGV